MSTHRKKVSNDFGSYGWSMIIWSCLAFMIGAMIPTGGLNVITMEYQANFGWAPSTLLAYATPAGMVGILGSLIFGQLIIRYGVRNLSVISIFIYGAAAIWMGYPATILHFVIALIFVDFLQTGFGLISPNTLMTSWFPTKKGLALGWATMGFPLASAVAVPLIGGLTGSFGLAKGFTYLGIGIIVFGIITFFWVKNTPEEIGKYPDNDKSITAEKNREFLERQKNYKSKYTIKVLLKEKNMWKIGIGFGLLWMVTIGVVIQLLPRLLVIGYERPTAIKIMTVCYVLGVIGSYFWGYLDEKFSTRTSSLIFGLTYVVGVIILAFSEHPVLVPMAVFIFGFGNGGFGNLMPSMIGTVYGRMDFPYINRVVTPLASIIRVCNFWVLSISLKMTGSLTQAYVFFAIASLVGALLIFSIKTVYFEEESNSVI